MWWEAFRVALAAFPPPTADAPFLALCEKFGLTAADSPYLNPDGELAGFWQRDRRPPRTRWRSW